MNHLVAVDASVALKWVLTNSQESEAERAGALLQDSLIGRRVFVVPPHFFAEVTNVIYQRVRTGRTNLNLTQAEADEALRTLLAIPVQPVSPPGLYQHALSIAQQYKLPGVYDALYLVVAELGECDLWTDDRRLLKALEGKISFVKWIGDYSAG